MKQLYFPYYWRVGVRRISDLLHAQPQDILALPKDTVYHHVPCDEKDNAPDPQGALFSHEHRRILVDFQDQDSGHFVQPRKTAQIVARLVRPFLVSNRKTFQHAPELELRSIDPQTLAVVDYGLIDELYRYPNNPLGAYQSRLNLIETVIDRISKFSVSSKKHHFIGLTVPLDLPPIQAFRTQSDKVTQVASKLFNTPHKAFFAQLWLWLGEKTREQSVLAKLDKQMLRYVNLHLTTPQGQVAALNLGVLNSFIKGEPNQTEFKSVSQYQHAVVQKLALAWLNGLTLVVEEDPTVVQGLAPAASREPQASEQDLPVEDLVALDQAIAAATIEQEADKAEENLELIGHNSLSTHGLTIAKDGEVVENVEPTVSDTELEDRVLGPKNDQSKLREVLDNKVKSSSISTAEHRKLFKQVQDAAEQPDPYGLAPTIAQAMRTDPKDLQLDSSRTALSANNSAVMDESFKHSSLASFDASYISRVMKKDVLAVVQAVGQAGVIVRKHDIEIESSILGDYEKHTLELKPIDGAASTVHFKIPVVDESGTFMSAGNKLRMKKQRVDLPIRKTEPKTVGLSSYYGKTFVSLDDKKANSSVDWIVKKATQASLEQPNHILQVFTADLYDPSFKAPFIYSALGAHVKIIKTKTLTLNFDHAELSSQNPKEAALLEINGQRLCGVTNEGTPLVIGPNEIIRAYDASTKTYMDLGDIYDVLQLNKQSAPIDFCTLRVFSKEVPVGVALGYYLGFKNMLRYLKVAFRYVESSRPGELKANEYAIRFKDCCYVFNREDRYTSSILAGFLPYEKVTKNYPAKEFDQQAVYFNMLTSKGLGTYYLKELDLLKDLFVDPITQEILRSMKLPQTFQGLLLESARMLTEFTHPVTQDMAAMRVRGYERIAGMIYRELSISVRAFKNRNYSGKTKVELSPYAVWNRIVKDPTVKIVEDTNPVQDLKEQEIVTFAGEGGRSKETMTKSTRSYHPSDRGIVSEGTVDSSDVGISAYLSPNAKLKDLRGLPDLEGSVDASQLVSTTALLSPAVQNEDMKRVGFSSIQATHIIACDGYHQPIVRTGYESITAYRVSPMFAVMAKQAGSVKELNEQGIVVEYADGSLKGYSLGRQFGKSGGAVYPHDIVSPLRLSQKFKAGDCIAYNSGFYEADFFEPTKIVMKNSMYVTTALLESAQTHEDSCAISMETSKRLAAKSSKIRSFTVDFKQNVYRVVSPGQEASATDSLLIIEDEMTSVMGDLDQASVELLNNMAKQAPRANYNCTVDKVEVLYNGDKADMSPTLKRLADASDRQKKAEAQSTNRPYHTGLVTDEYRIKGTPLAADKAEIRIYLTLNNSAGVGDKSVLGNQLKTVVAEVMDYDVRGQRSGRKIDAIFGYRSILARIVASPVIMGTTASLMILAGQKAAELYET